jgi:hypothetical protein
MSEVARVKEITRTQKGGPNQRVDIDIVQLSWNGMAYFWETPVDKYRVDEHVPVDPPLYVGGRISPKGAGS